MRLNPITLYERVEDFLFRGVDPRPYEMIRIFYGFCSLLNVTHLWFYRIELFSDVGIVPPEHRVWGVWEHLGSFPSLFLSFGSPLEVSILFAIAFLASILCMVGLGSRIAMILLFLFSVSYSHRAGFVLSGYDALFRIVGFIMCFSPIGQMWSLDQILRGRRKATPAPTSAPYYGLFLIKWHVTWMYLITFWEKTPNQYWRNGELWSYFFFSVYSIIQDPIFAQILYISTVMTYLSLMIEGSLPFLLWSRRYRWWGLLAGGGLHGGILFSKVPIFSLMVFCCYLAFLEREDLGRIIQFLRRARILRRT